MKDKVGRIYKESGWDYLEIISQHMFVHIFHTQTYGYTSIKFSIRSLHRYLSGEHKFGSYYLHKIPYITLFILLK
jgi:hypothetical protein